MWLGSSTDLLDRTLSIVAAGSPCSGPTDRRATTAVRRRHRGGIRISEQARSRRLAINPGLALGECYMDGTLVPVNGSIHDVLDVLMDNTNDAEVGRRSCGRATPCGSCAPHRPVQPGRCARSAMSRIITT